MNSVWFSLKLDKLRICLSRKHYVRDSVGGAKQAAM